MPGVLIDLELRYAQALDGLERVSKAGADAAKSLDSVFGVAKAGLVGLASAFSADVFVGKFKDAAHSMDALNDASDRTGASVEQLSSLLNTLRPHGGTLEGITDATSKLVRAMQGADVETSKAAEAFDALGIKSKDSAGNLRDPIQVLEEVARSLDRYQDGANKTALAQALFGKSGAELLPILKDLARSQKEASTVSTQQAEEAERLVKALERLKVASDNAWQSLASKFIPALASLAEQFVLARKEGLSFWESFKTIPGPNSSKDVQIQGEVDAIQKLQDARDKLASAQDKNRARGSLNVFVDEEIKKLDTQIGERQKRLDVLRKQNVAAALVNDPTLQGPEESVFARGKAPQISGPDKKEKISDGDRLIQQLKEQIYGTAELTELQKVEAGIAIGKYKDITPAQRKVIQGLADELQGLKDINEARKKDEELQRVIDEAEKRDRERLDREAEAVAKLVEHYRDLGDPLSQYAKKIAEINDLQAKALLSDGDASRARLAVYDDMFKAQDKLTEKTKDSIDFVKDFGLKFESAFEKAVFGAGKLSDALKGLLSDIARIVLRKTTLEPLTNSILGLFAPNPAASLGFTGTALDDPGFGIGVSPKKSVASAGTTVIQYNTFGSDVTTTTLAAWGQSIKGETLRAVKEAQKR